MLRERRNLLLMLHVAAWLAIVHSQSAQTVDTQQPIIRSVPVDQDEYAYFGYSVVLHQLSPNTGSTSMMDALGNTRIIVGAPNGTAPNSAVDNTGLIYTCPVQMGGCSRLGGNNQNDDLRLFDTQANGNLEDKSGQFMGVSLASKGDTFITCAHKYLNFEGTDTDSARNPFGRCFFSGRDLSGFTEYQPCDGVGSRGTYSVGACQAGTSAALASTTAGTIGIAVGAPGVYTWRGIVVRRDPSSDTNYEGFGEGTQRFGLQGYSMTSGRFIRSDREDFAVSVPRLNMYFGAVNIVLNTPALSVVSQPLEGRQMGEYYGFSLVAVDLTGDNIDEILVGAPQYRHAGTSPETGRVYVYSNIGGSLQEFSQIIGFEAYSRFGYAMATLGDISGDGLDDVAISAPFGNGSGTVYIFHSSASQLLNPVPQQIIIGSELPVAPSSIIAGLKGFGTSLASGVDVDSNSYNDLAIGSFQSQKVFLLRTRPLAEVTTTMSASPNVIDLDDLNIRCDFEGTLFTCFNVTACASYDGRGVGSSLPLTFTLFAERRSLDQGLEQRLFFSNPMGNTPGMFPNTTSRMVAVDANVQNCQVFTVYVQQGISDRFNSFTIDLEVSTQELNVLPQDGNQMPVDFSNFPIVSAIGAPTLQVEIAQDCGGEICIPDLRLTIGEINYETTSGQTADRLTAGLVSSFTIALRIDNDRLDAFLAQLSFALPTRLLEFVRVEPRSVFVTCPVTEEFTEDNTAFTRHNCSIGNPFRGGRSLEFSLRLSPMDGLTGGEGNIVINHVLTSLNPEDPTTRANNADSTTHPVDARADIFLDVPGFVSPEQVSYTSVVPVEPIVNASQLGPVFLTSFVVRNSGPSTVPDVQLVINWPLNSSETGENFYLYPAQIRSISSGGSVTCENRFVNTQQLLLGPSEENFDNSEGGAGGSVGVSIGGRRRRSVPRSARRKRQMEPTEPVEEARDRTLSCIEGQISEGLMCAAIVCNIFQLPGNGSAEVVVEAYLDERYFSGQVGSFTFIPTANVSISPGITFITEPETGTSDTSSAQVRVIPATAPLVTTPTSVPWYAIAIPIIVAVLLIAAVAGVLWGFGFFRRKKHEELKQRREELQALDTSSENIVDGEQ